jgi:glutathione S-transferase
VLPTLYTFRRCPYAIRARMALAYAGVEFELREVVLRDKPASMLALSEKGTVPVLRFGDEVIDESLAIVEWALQQNDPSGWKMFASPQLLTMSALIELCDREFKYWLDRYKYADRYPEQQPQYYRTQCEVFLGSLELRLDPQQQGGSFLFGANLCYADVAIFPFVRQFSFVDKDWFDASSYPHLHAWLESHLSSDLFLRVMDKYPQWRLGHEPTVFSSSR